MKKTIAFLTALLLIPALCFGAWDASKPTDNEKLKDTPAELRANWAALALGTDSALQVTNAKVSATAAIVDTKLAQITTASKVSGAAITLLTNLPSGAGRIPRVNTPLVSLDTPVTLADGAGSVIDASTGSFFTQSASADRTLGTPTNPTDGQKIIIRFYASSGARTLTLPVAGNGDFSFGSDVTAITQTVSGKYDYIGCIYNGTSQRWNVVAYAKGY